MSYTTMTEKLMDKANLLKVQFELDPSMSYIEASKLLKHLKKRLKNLVKRYLKSNRMASTDIRVKLSHTDAGALSLCINVRWVGLADEREAATDLLDILRTHMFGDETLSSHIREKAPAVWDWMTVPTPHHQLFKHASVFNNRGATEETVGHSLFVSKSLELRFVVTPSQTWVTPLRLLREICDAAMKESYGENSPVIVDINQAYLEHRVIQIRVCRKHSPSSAHLSNEDAALSFLDIFRKAVIDCADSKPIWDQFPSLTAWLNDDKSHADLYDTNELYEKEPVITYQL